MGKWDEGGARRLRWGGIEKKVLEVDCKREEGIKRIFFGYSLI